MRKIKKTGISNWLTKYGYLLALGLGFGLRIFQLGLNPIGITHDEIHDLINAKSLALTFKSAPGTVAGIFNLNKVCLGNCVFGELVSYLLVPWMRFFPLDIFWSKIPFILASLAIVYFGGRFLENLTGERKAGIITSFLIAINPWAIFFGRTALENLFTFGFYLLSLYLFTKKDAGKKDLFFGLLAAVLGFLSYFGAKPLFPFLIFWGVAFYLAKNRFKNLKFAGLIAFLAIFLTLGYLVMIKNTAVGIRLSELKPKDLSSRVDEQRRVSLEIPVIRDLVINKFTVMIKDFAYRHFRTFSPSYLFVQGEMGYDALMIAGHAYFYWVDFFFILTGLILMARKRLKELVFLIFLILVIPVSSTISQSGVTYGLRSGLIFPLLLGLAGFGVWGLVEAIKPSLVWKPGNWLGNLASSRITNLAAIRPRKLLGMVLAGAYFLSFGYFWLMYFYRTPFERNRGWFFHERVLIDYSKRSQAISPTPITIVSKNPIDFLYLYGFYTGKYNQRDFIKTFNQKIESQDFRIDNLTVLGCCPETIDEAELIVIEAQLDCLDYPKDWLRINDLEDNGQKFVIQNDQLCQGLELNPYPYPRKIQEFDLNKLDRETFCRTWLVDLTKIQP